MKIKTLLIGGVTLLASILPAKAQEAFDASVTWAMGCPVDAISGVSTTDYLTPSFTKGSEVSQKNESATFMEETYTHFLVTTPLATTDINRSISFKITPTGTFKPSSISYQFANQGWGDGRYTLVVECGNYNKVLKDKVTPIRDNQTSTKPYDEINLSGITATPEAPIIFTLYFQSKNDNTSNRPYIMRNFIVNGVATAEVGELPEKPEIPDGAVVAPLGAGTYYDLSQAISNGVAPVGTDIGNTYKGTSIDFPFYLENEASIFFYLEQGAQQDSNGTLLISLDGNKIGEHEVEITGGWSNYTAVSVIRMENLASGKHVVTVARDDSRCTEHYAGNWRISLHAEDVYGHEPINLNLGTYVNGIRAENGGANAGNIRNGASAEYRVYIQEAGAYELNLGIKKYGEGTCKVSVKEEGIEASFDMTPQARSYSDIRHISLGDIKTPGIKTLRLEFTAPPETNYIANYDNLNLVRTGDISGIADVETAEVVAVEYYNLQGVRVEAGACGALIRVSTLADGSRKADKVIVR